jgi:hypothetical protein
MGYNLWLSEDSHYTLGHRIGSHDRQPVQPDPEPRVETRPGLSRAELDHIDFLMETLANRLESQRRA